MKRKLWIILAVAALLGALCCGVALADASGSCGDSVTWLFSSSTGALTISGTGPMRDSWNYESAPWAQYRSSIRSVVIESGVTSIGQYAFYGCSKMTSVTIPDSVTSIGFYAFYQSSSLTSLTIPSGMTSIDDHAFRGCSGLTSVTISDGLTWIGANAFMDCSGLTRIIIPSSVTNIRPTAFLNCASLTSVAILSPTATIGDSDFDVFEGCPASLTLCGYTGSTAQAYAEGAGLTFRPISDACGTNVTWAFSPGTGTLTISGSGPMTDSWNYEAAPWAVLRSDIRSVVIESGVTTIGPYAFYGCPNMTSVTIPNSVISIGYAAFTGCKGLPSIIIPSSVTSISNYAFSTCTGLTSVSIHNPDCVIGGTGHDVFYLCLSSLVLHGWTGSTTETYALVAGHQFQSLGVNSGVCGSNLTWYFDLTTGRLTISGTGAMDDYPGDNYPGWYAHREIVTSVSIGNGVTYIGEYAFYNMYALEQVTIGTGVTGIGNFAFQNCPNLTAVAVPGVVTGIGNGCFRGCSRLTRATILNPNCAFGTSVFTNCPSGLDLYGWPGSTTETYAGASLGFVSLGSLSGACGDNVVYSFNPVNQILTISGTGPMEDYPYGYPDWNEYREYVSGAIVQNGVTTVGGFAFYELPNLTMAVVANSVTSIGRGAYYGCERLTGITLPESVTSIGRNAFAYCDVLASVTIRHPECVIGEETVGVFNNTFEGLVLRGWPGSTAEACAQAEGHGFESLGTISGPCGDNVTWAFNPGTGRLTISGTGAIADYWNDTPGWYEYNYYITEIFVAEGVTSIGAYAFTQMSSVTSAVLPDSLTSIGSRAFNQCSTLYGLVIPQNVTSVGSYAFSMCGSLTSVIIKNPDCAIGSGGRNVFMLCPSLVLTGWPGSTAEAYAQAAGHGFESLGAVLNLPADLTTIEAEAFAGVRVRAVRIPSKVTSIASNAFTGSALAYVFGVPGSAAQDFADSHYNYFFVPVAD